MDHFVFIPFCIALILYLKHLCVSIQNIDLKATYYNGDGMLKLWEKNTGKFIYQYCSVLFCTIMTGNN